VNNERIITLLRLGQKAGSLIIGKSAVQLLLRKKRIALAIVALDAPDKLKQQIEFDCRRLNIPMVLFATKDALGEMCGRESVTTVAVTDRNLAAGLRQEFQ